jgi:hypothetical protein
MNFSYSSQTEPQILLKFDVINLQQTWSDNSDLQAYWPTINRCINKAIELSWVLLASDSQATTPSGYRASLWDPWPYFILLFFFFWQLLYSSFEGALSDEKTGLYFTVQSPTSLVINAQPYCTASSETVFPFCRLLRLAGTTVEVF